MWHVVLVIPFSIVWTKCLETQLVFLESLWPLVHLKECITCQKRNKLIKTGLFLLLTSHCLLLFCLWHIYSNHIQLNSPWISIWAFYSFFLCRKVSVLGQVHLFYVAVGGFMSCSRTLRTRWMHPAVTWMFLLFDCRAAAKYSLHLVNLIWLEVEFHCQTCYIKSDLSCSEMCSTCTADHADCLNI